MIGKVSIDLIALQHSNKGKTLLEKHDAVTGPKAQSSLWSRVTRTRGRKIALATTAALSVIGLTAGTVSALTTSQSGGAILSQRMVTNDQPFTAIGASWTNLPGASATVTVPSGTTRLVDARYTSEAQCLAPVTANKAINWCSARIVVSKVGGGTTELLPAAGSNFALASVGGPTDGVWQPGVMERSNRLSAGTYVVRVQALKYGASITEYRIDDTHLAVTVSS